MTEEELRAIESLYEQGYSVTAANDLPKLFAALRLSWAGRDVAIEAFHQASRLRSEIQKARIKAEDERDTLKTKLKGALADNETVESALMASREDNEELKTLLIHLANCCEGDPEFLEEMLCPYCHKSPTNTKVYTVFETSSGNTFLLQEKNLRDKIGYTDTDELPDNGMYGVWAWHRDLGVSVKT